MMSQGPSVGDPVGQAVAAPPPLRRLSNLIDKALHPSAKATEAFFAERAEGSYLLPDGAEHGLLYPLTVFTC